MTPEQIEGLRALLLRKRADGQGFVMPTFGMVFSGPRFCCPSCSGLRPSHMVERILSPVTGDRQIDELYLASVPRMRSVILSEKDDPTMDRFVAVVKRPFLPEEGVIGVDVWAPAAVLAAQTSDLGYNALLEGVRLMSPEHVPVWVDCPDHYYGLCASFHARNRKVGIA